MKKKNKKIVKGILIASASLFLLLMLVIAIAVNFVFTPERITPMVRQVLAQQTEERIDFSRVELTYFSTFPRFGLRIDSIRVRETADPAAVPLLTLDRVSVSFNPTAFVFGNKIVVNRLFLENPAVSLLIDREGKSVLDLFTGSETDTVSTASDTVRFDSEIDIKRIRVLNARIRIEDQSKNMLLETDSLNLKCRGNWQEKSAGIAFEISSPRIYMREQGQVLLRNLKLYMDSDMTWLRDSTKLRLDKAILRINGLALGAKGTLQADTAARSVTMDITAGLRTPSLAELLKLIPPAFIQQEARIKTGGEVLLTARLAGTYGPESQPELWTRLKIDDASARYGDMKWGIDRVTADLDAYVDLMRKQTSYLNIKQLDVTVADSSSLSLTGEVTDLLRDPAVSFDIVSNLNITRLMEVFPLQAGITLQGQNTTRIKGGFLLKDLQNQDYGKMKIEGESDFKDLMIYFNPDSLQVSNDSTSYLYVQMKTGQFKFGSDRTKRIQTAGRDSANLSADINFSGLAFRDKSGKAGSLSDIRLELDSDVASDTNRITRLHSAVTLGNASFENPDTLSVGLSQGRLGLDIVPGARNPKRPDILFRLQTDSLDVSAPQTGTQANLSRADIRLTTTPPMQKGKGRWRTRGTLNFSDLNIFTRLFPIPIRMDSSELAFRRDTLTLRNTNLFIGQSDMTASGSVNNLLGTFLSRNDNGLTADLSIRSKRIDLNPIIAAANASIANEQEDAYAAVSIETDTTDIGLMQIPPKIGLQLQVDADSLIIDRVPVRNINGAVAIRDQVLTLSDLNAEVLGAPLHTYGRYKPLSASLAEMGMELNLKSIDISQIPDFFPITDSLMPMFRSFDGKITLNMHASGELREDYTFALPSVKAVLHVEGQNMVLMDSETFASISKMLMFKNKERNLIDSLSLDIVMDDSRIDVVPFEASVDRYRAIIGGTQTIDSAYNIDFKYNISIMKSPLPFKAGVDIFGNLDDFDFKITKAKLKKTDFEQQAHDIDSIRNAIRESIR